MPRLEWWIFIMSVPASLFYTQSSYLTSGTELAHKLHRKPCSHWLFWVLVTLADMTASIIFHNTKKGHMHPKCLHTLKNCHMLGFFYIYCTWAWNAFLTCFMPTVFFCVFAFCVFFPGLRDRLFSFFANGIELVLFILKHFPNQPASCSLHSHHPLPPANSYHFHFHAFNAGLKRSASTYLCASITATSSAFSTCYAATIYIMLFGHCEAKMWKIKQSLFQLFTYFCSDKTFVHLVHWQTSWSHLECFFFYHCLSHYMLTPHWLLFYPQSVKRIHLRLSHNTPSRLLLPRRPTELHLGQLKLRLLFGVLAV